MNKQEFCSDCPQRDECQQVYRRLGQSRCGPVGSKSAIAFLIPIAVFIVSLVVFGELLGSGTAAGAGRTAAQFGLSAAVTLAVVAGIRLVCRRRETGPHGCSAVADDQQGEQDRL